MKLCQCHLVQHQSGCRVSTKDAHIGESDSMRPKLLDLAGIGGALTGWVIFMRHKSWKVVVTTLSVGLWSGSVTIFIIQWITYAVAVNTDGVITTGTVVLHFRSHS